MTTRRRKLLGSALAVGLSVTLVGSTSGSGVVKVPAYLLIRGDALESPVVIHNGPRVGNVIDSPVLRLLMSITGPEDAAPEPTTLRHYEVFEFFMGRSAPPPALDGGPSEPLDPANADLVGRIYPDEPGGAVWNRFPTGGAPYRTVSEQGLEVLRAAGLDLDH